MENIRKYTQCFCEVFSWNTDFDVSTAKMGDTSDWDSVGHMELITEIEEKFGIELETEDILGFTSYTKGIEILNKYGIQV